MMTIETHIVVDWDRAPPAKCLHSSCHKIGDPCGLAFVRIADDESMTRINNTEDVRTLHIVVGALPVECIFPEALAVAPQALLQYSYGLCKSQPTCESATVCEEDL